jgi:hypothetical protein
MSFDAEMIIPASGTDDLGQQATACVINPTKVPGPWALWNL